MRGLAVTRSLRLLQMLEARQGLEIDEAVQELGALRRTIYRDLQILQDIGFPLLNELNGRRARWRINPGYRHRLQLALSLKELLGLLVATQQLGALAGTPLHEGAVSAFDKIRATLPRGLAEAFKAFDRITLEASASREFTARSGTLMSLARAISTRKSVEARYRAQRSGRPQTRRLDPLHLAIEHDTIYLLAYCHRRRRIQTFLLDRFDSVSPVDQTFAMPRHFEPKQFLSAGFRMWGAGGKAQRVHFTARGGAAQGLMERKIHPSQRAQMRDDHTVEITLSVVPGPPLVAYLCSLGPDVAHIEPEALAKAVAERHRLALEENDSGIGPLRPLRRKSTRQNDVRPGLTHV